MVRDRLIGVVIGYDIPAPFASEVERSIYRLGTGKVRIGRFEGDRFVLTDQVEEVVSLWAIDAGTFVSIVRDEDQPFWRVDVSGPH